jgi:hypothetical protein
MADVSLRRINTNDKSHYDLMRSDFGILSTCGETVTIDWLGDSRLTSVQVKSLAAVRTYHFKGPHRSVIAEYRWTRPRGGSAKTCDPPSTVEVGR